MRETRADTVQATVLAIGLHVLLFAIALLGIWWTRSAAPVSAAGPVIEAELIDPDALSASLQRVLRDRPEPIEPAPAEPPPVERETIPPPQPVIEPVPQDALEPPQVAPQEQLPDPDIVEQERASAQAIADREAAEREQEERRRQEQVELEREQQEQAERERRRTEMQRQREAQLADIRRRRGAAEREAEQAQQKLEQLEAAQEAARLDAAPPGNAGDSTELTARYAAALQEAILRQWTRPETVPLGQRCRIVIRQIPGGEVIDAKVDPSCPYDERGRRSIEAAVLKAQPLPYAGFEAVFNRTLILNFEAQDR